MTFDEFVEPKQEKLPFWFEKKNGHIVSMYPLIPGILNLPAFFLAYTNYLPSDIVDDRDTLTMTTTVFIAAGSVVLMYLCLLSLFQKKHTAIFFSLAYAFSTNVWSIVSRGLWQHGPSILFLNGIVLILLKQNIQLFWLAGLLTGILVWNRPTNIVFAVAISIFVLWKHRRAALPFFFPAGIVALLFAWYSSSFYGSILALGQGQPLTWFSGSVIPNIFGLLFSPGRGLFVYTPLFLLAFPALARLYKKKSDLSYSDHLILLLFFSLIPFLLIYSKWSVWWGGNVYSYRIITEVVTPLTLLVATLWRTPSQTTRFMNAALVITITWSFFAQYLGVVRYPLCDTKDEKRIEYGDTTRFWDVQKSSLYRCAKRLFDPRLPYKRRPNHQPSIREDMDIMSFPHLYDDNESKNTSSGSSFGNL